MKKIKWILLLITILIGIVFLFATCKKTNAYTTDFNNPFLHYNYNLDSQNNNGFSFIINTDTDIYNIFILKSNTSSSYLLSMYNDVLSLYNYTTSRYDYAINVSNNKTHLIYCQFVYDYILEKIYIYISPIDINVTNRQDESPIISSITLNRDFTNTDNYWELTGQFRTDFISSQSQCVLQFQESTSYNTYGLIQFYTFNVLDNFSDAIDEQVEFLFDDIKQDIPKEYYNFLIDNYYTTGYNAGYQLGYNRGYSDGYSLGTNEGYNDGYQAGQEDTQLYQNGYNAGYTAGYSDGEMSTDAYDLGYSTGYDEGQQNGYRDGYNSGYLYGYEQGQEGENVITPAFSVISSVFGVVASVMSIQLFPGITIGLLILVPLFFAVLGLILWIWRRN